MEWSEDFASEASSRFVECIRRDDANFIKLRGIYRFNTSIEGTEYKDEFDITLIVDKTYKLKIPLLVLLRSAVPKGFEHVNPSGECCLGTAHEILSIWGESKDTGRFFEYVIDPYLANIISFRRTGECATRERAHGYDGLKCYYSNLLNMTPDEADITLKYVFNRIGKEVEVRGHDACPCGSGKKLRGCHFKTVKVFIEGLNANKFLREGFIQDMAGMMENERRKRGKKV